MRSRWACSAVMGPLRAIPAGLIRHVVHPERSPASTLMGAGGLLWTVHPVLDIECFHRALWTTRWTFVHNHARTLSSARSLSQPLGLVRWGASGRGTTAQGRSERLRLHGLSVVPRNGPGRLIRCAPASFIIGSIEHEDDRGGAEGGCRAPPRSPQGAVHEVCDVAQRSAAVEGEVSEANAAPKTLQGLHR